MKTRTKYNPEQIEQTLALIATKADICRVLLTYAAQNVDSHEAAYQINAAEALIELIGAAADHAADGVLRGGFEEWFYGDDFNKAGAA